MDPDLDDPNNHVPPVSPDDDWGDLDVTEESRVAGPSTGRPDRGIPPRKEGRKPRVNHHAPKLKLHDDSTYSPLEPKSAAREEEESLDMPEDPMRKTASKTTKKAVKGTAKKAVKKARVKSANRMPEEPVAETVRNSAATTPAETAHEAQADVEPERVVLPPSHGGNRFRVNEIGASHEATSQRVPKMYPKTDAEKAEKPVKSAGRPRRRFSRGERSDWGQKSARGSFRWMLYTGVGVLALIVVAVILSDPGGGGKSREMSMFSQLAPEESEAATGGGDGDMMAMLTSGQEEAKRIFAKYATAKSVADFLAYIHRSEDIAALVEKNWEPIDAKPGWKPDEQAVWTVREQEGVRYGALGGGLPDFTSYRAFFRQDDNGLKMDWKATVGYCSAEFETLKKGQGDGSEVRAWLSPADFHTFPLREGEFRAFRLGSPDGQESLWGYTKIGGELDSSLVAQFIPSQITGEAQTEIGVVVSLERGPADSLPNQWMITKLVRLNWLDE
jgi:hypothetical protein